MLEQLKEYALSHGLEPEPGFKPKDIRWAIVIQSAKGFVDIEELGDAGQKKNPGKHFPKCPDLMQGELISGRTTRSHFLVDTAGVVCLYGDPKDGDPEAAKKLQTQVAKHKYLLGLLMQAGQVMPELSRIAAHLDNETTLAAIRERMQTLKIKPNEKVTFSYDGGFPLESNAWHEWWRSFRTTLREKPVANKKNGPSMRCFITGRMVHPVATHWPITGLLSVGGHAKGDTLVCFDKEAFRSYSLEQAANAAVSEEAANAYRTGIDYLIKETGQRLAGAIVIHWFKEKVPARDDPMVWLNGIEGAEEQAEINAQQRAKELLESIRTGKRADLTNNRYYALTLSGQSGRVMVRDWMEEDFFALACNINNWFRDLEITNLNGTGPATPPGMERVITCLLEPQKPNQKYNEWVKPIGSERMNLWVAATRGLLISHALLSKLVILNRNFVVSGELNRLIKKLDEKDKKPLQFPDLAILSMVYARIGLIKAYHNRKKRKEGSNTLDEMLQPALNENYPGTAYQCGRLMALLAELQRVALGDVGAGVVQRYYAAASATPALVLGRLARTSQYHLGKLEPKLARWYENKISNIWNSISGGIPATLNLEEQSLFAMGYYQQLAALRAPKAAEDNINTNKKEQ